MNHFPAGMELFPASDATPWEIIENVIDDSDYYVLVVGGTYGSMDSKGISYTEREYDYARNKGKPVLAFLHASPETIPAGKVDLDFAVREKLSVFRKKVQLHHCRYWNDARDLQYKVATSLAQEMNRNPGIGWIRANEATREDTDKIRIAQEQAEEQRRLREDAEIRARLAHDEITLIRKREAEAKADVAAAAAKEATALQREREAKGEVSRRTADAEKTAEYKLPTGFLQELAREILLGKSRDLDGLMVWHETPQGHVFWSKQHKLLSETGELSPEATEIIEKWIKLE
jgi:hypothetical protein